MGRNNGRMEWWNNGRIRKIHTTISHFLPLSKTQHSSIPIFHYSNCVAEVL
jgi:hypothetical protein